MKKSADLIGLNKDHITALKRCAKCSVVEDVDGRTMRPLVRRGLARGNPNKGYSATDAGKAALRSAAR